MKTKNSIFLPVGVICLLMTLSGCDRRSEKYSRGVGIYPGNPKEDFSPSLVTDNKNYRNLAKFRPAYHSSSYDYNLTAQLVTDGIIIHDMPDFISLSTNKGEVPKNEREWLLDNNSVTEMSLTGNDIWIQLETNPGNTVPEMADTWKNQLVCFENYIFITCYNSRNINPLKSLLNRSEIPHPIVNNNDPSHCQ